MEVDVALRELVRALPREDHHAVRLLPDVLGYQEHGCGGHREQGEP